MRNSHRTLAIALISSAMAACTAADTGPVVDLAAEGRLMWQVTSEEGWAFEGSPVADGQNVYVAMRRSGARPEAHVACLDAQTGQRRWRRFSSWASQRAFCR